MPILPPKTFLDLLNEGHLRLTRRENISLATMATRITSPNVRRAVLIVTNITANQADLSWENGGVAADGGEYQLQQRDTYIELYDVRAGGVGEPIWGNLFGVKTTGAGNVRVVEYEVYR